jgi:hypothetical protein
MTCRYYRTSRPVTARPMIMRWISDVPSKIVKLVEVRAVTAGRWPVYRHLVSTNSAPNAARTSDKPGMEKRLRYHLRRPDRFQDYPMPVSELIGHSVALAETAETFRVLSPAISAARADHE